MTPEESSVNEESVTADLPETEKGPTRTEILLASWIKVAHRREWANVAPPGNFPMMQWVYCECEGCKLADKILSEIKKEESNMSFGDMGKKADEMVDKGKQEAQQMGNEINGLSRNTRYAIGALAVIAVLGIGSCMVRGCGRHEPASVPAAVNVQPVQPTQGTTIINNGDSGAGNVLAGAAVGYAIGSLMSNGEHYNGHNWNGPAPQGYQVDPKTHSVTKVVIIDKRTTTPTTPVAPTTTPKPTVTTAPVAPTVKVKNPGDATAVAEQQKMAQEKAVTEQKRVADLKARKASLYKSRATNTKSGFSSFSKKSRK